MTARPGGEQGLILSGQIHWWLLEWDGRQSYMRTGIAYCPTGQQKPPERFMN